MGETITLNGARAMFEHHRRWAYEEVPTSLARCGWSASAIESAVREHRETIDELGAALEGLIPARLLGASGAGAVRAETQSERDEAIWNAFAHAAVAFVHLSTIDRAAWRAKGEPRSAAAHKFIVDHCDA